MGIVAGLGMAKVDDCLIEVVQAWVQNPRRARTEPSFLLGRFQRRPSLLLSSSYFRASLGAHTATFASRYRILRSRAFGAPGLVREKFPRPLQSLNFCVEGIEDSSLVHNQFGMIMDLCSNFIVALGQLTLAVPRLLVKRSLAMPVHVLARGRNLLALQERGIEVHSPEESLLMRVKGFTDVEAARLN